MPDRNHDPLKKPEPSNAFTLACILGGTGLGLLLALFLAG